MILKCFANDSEMLFNNFEKLSNDFEMCFYDFFNGLSTGLNTLFVRYLQSGPAHQSAPPPFVGGSLKILRTAA